MRYFPRTVEARASTRFVHRWDLISVILSTLALYGLYLMAALDHKDGGVQPPTWTFWIGLAVYAGGYILVFWVLFTNPFATGSSRLQEDQGQRVIEAGPYAYLRHPMYAAIFFFLVSEPLVLQSWWAFLPTPLVLAAYFYRCAREDKMLLEGLVGYREYASRVRHRMIPWVW